MKQTNAALLVLALIFAQTVPAFAEQGLLNALSLKPVPDGQAISVVVYDDSDQNLKLKQLFENSLQAAGYDVQDNAPLALTFTAGDQIGAWNSASRGHLLSLQTRASRDGEKNSNEARVNVFDSNSGGLFNKDSGDRNASAQKSQYRLEVILEDASNGRAFWRAWSVADLEFGDGATLTEKMVPVIIEELGNSVKSRTFDIR